MSASPGAGATKVPRAKIQVPRVPSNTLPRQRLLRVLANADEGDFVADDGPAPVVVVSAPAGYGKSTLLATHARELRRQGVPVAWVSCERHDNDPARLWSAMLQAISTELRHTDVFAAEAFAALIPPQHEMEPAFIAEFVEAVDMLSGPTTLVLDDVHELVAPAAVHGLDELLRNPPRALRLLLGCRSDPLLALPRLRLEGRLREVRADDLAFTIDEAHALLSAQQATLSADTVAVLVRRTEGWPAALRLAALSLLDEADPDLFVAAFAGDQRAIADYLVAEVLSRQPAELRAFLVATSVVEKLTVDLAVSLSGRVDAGAILHRLERANALVTRLGPRRTWYRYHTLLRSFLLAELRSGDIDAARGLHAVASDWFADANMPNAALEQALAAADSARLLALLRRFALRQLLSGTGTTVREVLASAPPEVAASPDAALLAGVDALERGDLSGAEHLLRSVEVPAPNDDPWLARLHDAAQLYLARMRGDVTVLSDPRSANALTDATPTVDGSGNDQDVELLLLANRGALRIAAGDYEDARSDVTQALDIALRNHRHYLALHCMNQLSAIAGAMSDLRGTKREAERAISFAADRGWGSSPRMAYAYTLAAWAAYQALDLETAARWASTAVGVIAGAMTPEVESAARFAEAVITFDRPSHRRAALQRMRRTWTTVASVTPSPALTAYAGMAELHMCLTLGEHMWARAAVDRVERMLGPKGDAVVMRALLLLRGNRIAQARRALAPLLRKGTRTTVITNDITARLVEAVAADGNDEPNATHTALMAALTLAEPIDALRPFYDMGEPVRKLLISCTGRLGHLDAFASRLLQAWSSAQEWQRRQADAVRDPVGAVRGHAPSQPLTVRELDVLRNLPSMLTTEEIAEAQVVSINTVKTHLRSIYRKLGVSSRREAVEAGRFAGIL